MIERSRPSLRLEPFLICNGWDWHRLPKLGHDFWMGCDPTGQKWLLKNRGSFNAFRERAFSILAQSLDITCQSSTYLILSRDSLPATQGCELNQLAIMLLDEHDQKLCAKDCALNGLSRHLDFADLKNAPIENLVDLARSEMLGYLCDMHEPPDSLFTIDHKFFSIDHELMFSNCTADLADCRWFTNSDGTTSDDAKKAASDLSRAIIDLPGKLFEDAIDIPEGYSVEMHWDVSQKVRGLKQRAKAFLELAENRNRC